SQVAPSRWNASSVSTCRELLRAPVSSFALSMPMPSCGKASRSRQPRVTSRVPIGSTMGLGQLGGSLDREVERVKGIEPSSVAWEATALPLSYTRRAFANGNPGCARWELPRDLQRAAQWPLNHPWRPAESSGARTLATKV